MSTHAMFGFTDEIDKNQMSQGDPYDRRPGRRRSIFAHHALCVVAETGVPAKLYDSSLGPAVGSPFADLDLEPYKAQALSDEPINMQPVLVLIDGEWVVQVARELEGPLFLPVYIKRD
jgi:hypothetical protein